MFEVGKKVICVKTHPDVEINGVKKGKVFKVLAIRKPTCKCHDADLHVGVLKPGIYTAAILCAICNLIVPDDTGLWWFGSSRFAPLTDETIGDKTIEELMGDTVTVDNERYFQLEQQNINHSA